MNLFGLFLVAIGVFAICGAAFDWQWFMNHPKARFLTSIIGRIGARVFYALLGTGVVIFGILVTAGIIQDSR